MGIIINVNENHISMVLFSRCDKRIPVNIFSCDTREYTEFSITSFRIIFIRDSHFHASMLLYLHCPDFLCLDNLVLNPKNVI